MTQSSSSIANPVYKSVPINLNPDVIGAPVDDHPNLKPEVSSYRSRSTSTASSVESFSLDTGRLRLSSTLSSIWTVGSAVLFWYITSVSITFVNKYLFGPASLNFNYQLFVTFCHCGFTSALLRVGFSTLSFFPNAPRVTCTTYCKFVVPIAFFTAIDIALCNESYSMVGVSTMTVIKSSTVVFTYLFSICFGLERFRWTLLGLVILIVGSVGLSVNGMTVDDWLGVVFLCVSVLAAALRWVIIHRQLQREKLEALQLMLLTQPLTAVFLALPACAIDVGRLTRYISEDFDGPTLFAAVLLVTMSVFLAFALIFSEFHLVALTSSVSLCVAGVGKEVLTILCAIVTLYEVVTWRTWIGISLSILGILLYSWVRHAEIITHADVDPIPKRKSLISDYSEENLEEGRY